MNEVQLFIQEVFPNPSQAVIQTPEAWIVTEDENQTAEYFLKFDKVNIRSIRNSGGKLVNPHENSGVNLWLKDCARSSVSLFVVCPK